MNWQGIVIHHTVTPQTTSVDTIRRFHVDRNGWADIGYHFLVGLGGDEPGRKIGLHYGRPLTMQGTHGSRTHNYSHIGVAFIGCWDPETCRQHGWAVPDVNTTRLYMAAAVQLILRPLVQVYGIDPDAILGHRDVKPTRCPGDLIDTGVLRSMVRST